MTRLPDSLPNGQTNAKCSISGSVTIKNSLESSGQVLLICRPDCPKYLSALGGSTGATWGLGMEVRQPIARAGPPDCHVTPRSIVPKLPRPNVPESACKSGGARTNWISSFSNGVFSRVPTSLMLTLIGIREVVGYFYGLQSTMQFAN